MEQFAVAMMISNSPTKTEIYNLFSHIKSSKGWIFVFSVECFKRAFKGTHNMFIGRTNLVIQHLFFHVWYWEKLLYYDTCVRNSILIAHVSEK